MMQSSVRQKKYAQKNGNSLSRLVENYLKSISTQEATPEELSPKVAKMKGVINLPEDFDYKKELGDALINKYS